MLTLFLENFGAVPYIILGNGIYTVLPNFLFHFFKGFHKKDFSLHFILKCTKCKHKAKIIITS
jgi:hypothetical protein